MISNQYTINKIFKDYNQYEGIKNVFLGDVVCLVRRNDDNFLPSGRFTVFLER